MECTDVGTSTYGNNENRLSYNDKDFAFICVNKNENEQPAPTPTPSPPPPPEFLDLAVANEFSDNVSILLGDGDGTFTEAAESPVSAGDGPFSVAVGDFDGDTILDLAVANAGFGSDDVSILLGDGDGTFSEAAESPVSVGDTPFSVTVGNFN